MVSDCHPRNARLPAESQIDVAGGDVARGTHVVYRHENVTGGDYLGQGLPQLPPPIPQQGYSLINTSVSGPSSPSYGVTVVDPTQSPVGRLDSSLHHKSPTCDDSQGSAFRETLGTFYDHHAPSPGPRGDLHDGWEELSYTPITALPETAVIPPRVALPMRQLGDSDAYNLQVGMPDTAQLRLDGTTFLLSPQDNVPSSSALDGLPPATFINDHVSPVAYYASGAVDHDSRDSQTSLASSSVNSYGASGDFNGEFLFSGPPHPRERNDIPTHPFESEQLLSTVAQNENPCGTPPLLRSPGDGQSQRSAARLAFSDSLLSPPPGELGHRYGHYESHHSSLRSGISARSDPGPSGSRVTANGSPELYPRNRKRKRPSDEDDEDEGTSRSFPRRRPAATQPKPSPTTGPRRIKINQTPYVCGNPQHHWVRQDPIDFTVDGQPGIRLPDALNPRFSRLDRGGDSMFQYTHAGSSISCRIQFPQYDPHMSQITTADHKKAHNPRTRKKLAFEVAKRVKRYVEKVGIDIPYENVILTKLVHASKASWQPELWYEQH